MAHQLHCIHIDAGAGAPDVDGRANVIGCCQSFGQRVNQVSFSRSNAIAVADFVADGNEVLSMAINFGADAISESVEVIACAIE